MENRVARLVSGIGINDADYATNKTERINGKYKVVWRCPFYVRWKNMLSRCYDSSYHKNGETYIGCIVDEPWKTFSVFKRWMKTQDWEGKDLDKDLLFPTNTIYSPTTCVFISRQINVFIATDRKSIGGHPTGVNYNTKQI